MSGLGKVLGAAAGVTGAVGALALGGIAAQRRAVRRYRALPSGREDADFDSLVADRTYSVVSADGLGLHVEEVGEPDAPVTVVFAHGWTLRLGAWHFQRIGLAGPGFGVSTDDDEAGPAARLVFYDQRSHGRSGRAGAGRSTLAAIAEDLAAVIGTAAPSGPLVIVGHSMGGMALMALAAAEPTLVAERLSGFVLIDTSAFFSREKGSRSALTGNLPLMRAVTATAGRFPRTLERGRPLAKDALWLLTRSYGFADPAVPVEAVDYLDRMISQTPVEVIAEFLPAILAHDVRAGLTALQGLPGAVVCGEQDRMTPPAQSRALAAALPLTDLVIVPDAGHNLMLERPVAVTDAIRTVLRRVAASWDAPGAAVGGRR